MILIAILLITPLIIAGKSELKLSIQEKMELKRSEMVERQLLRRDIRDVSVLKAMKTVPRHLFVPVNNQNNAYIDGPLSIGYNQTISQPYIVALMTQLAVVDSTSKVLEIGTGSGYQAAVLAEIVDSVYTIEIVEFLCESADSLLKELHYNNIEVRCGDGYHGWLEHVPFDAIIVTAAPDHIPQPLIDQLRIGGRIVIPVGEHYQELLHITKTENGTVKQSVIPVRFVPMTGEAQE